jgi:hypothetical protein
LETYTGNVLQLAGLYLGRIAGSGNYVYKPPGLQYFVSRKYPHAIPLNRGHCGYLLGAGTVYPDQFFDCRASGLFFILLLSGFNSFNLDDIVTLGVLLLVSVMISYLAAGFVKNPRKPAGGKRK